MIAALIWTGIVVWALVGGVAGYAVAIVGYVALMTSVFVLRVMRKRDAEKFGPGTPRGWLRYWFGCFKSPPDYVTLADGRGRVYWPGTEPRGKSDDD